MAGAIAPSVADLDAGGPVLVRFRGATPYLSTGSAVVLSAAAAGHDVLVDPGAPTPVFPWREARRFTDQEVGLELWVVGGPGGADLPEGARTLATTATLDEAARREVRAEIEHARLLVADGVERGPRGASAADSLDQIDRVLGDPTAAFDSGELAGLAARGLVSVEGLSADDLFTLERLKGLAAEEAVALYLVTSEQRR